MERRLSERVPFGHVDVKGEIPAYVGGRLDGADADDAVVGVVNGRLAGVGVLNAPDDPLVALLMDPSYFNAGKNDVQYFLRVDDHTLAPL